MFIGARGNKEMTEEIERDTLTKAIERLDAKIKQDLNSKGIRLGGISDRLYYKRDLEIKLLMLKTLDALRLTIRHKSA